MYQNVSFVCATLKHALMHHDKEFSILSLGFVKIESQISKDWN